VFNFTKDNYFRWGYTKEPFSMPPNHPMDVNLWWDCSGSTMPARTPWSLRAETLAAARDIANSATKPIRLFLSGGIDSEVMLHAFRAINADFEVACIEYEYGFNHHEVEVAEKITQMLGLDLIRIRIDPFRLWYNIPQWMKPLKLESGAMYVVIEALWRSHDRFCVIGGNPQFVAREQQRLELLLKPSMLCHMMTFIELDNPGVSFFHFYSPQQFVALLRHPFMQAWIAQMRGTNVFDFDQIKPMIYQMEFPEVLLTRPKWTGEEKLWNHIRDLYYNQWSENRPFNPKIQRPLEQVEQELQRYLPNSQ
jgi:hypothetical protein